jgi:hypothetical protein
MILVLKLEGKTALKSYAQMEGHVKMDLRNRMGWY